MRFFRRADAATRGRGLLAGSMELRRAVSFVRAITFPSLSVYLYYFLVYSLR
jgi:hypothetical protein